MWQVVAACFVASCRLRLIVAFRTELLWTKKGAMIQQISNKRVKIREGLYILRLREYEEGGNSW